MGIFIDKNRSNVHERIFPIVKKFLYHNNYLPRLIIFIGLSKFLIGDKIEFPQFYLSRLIVQLFNSYEIIDKQSEEFHTKLYEIFMNFIIYYTNNPSNIKIIMEATAIILITKLLDSVIKGSTANNNQLVDTVLYNYLNTKLEHLVSFINVVYNISSKTHDTNKFYVFKVFKFITFFLLYISLEDDIMEKTKCIIKNLHSNRINILNIVKKFFEKSKLDKFLIEKVPDNYRMKFNKFLNELNKNKLLNKISDSFCTYLDEKQNEEDSKLEEQSNGLNTYFENNVSKYFLRIESYYQFLLTLKDERINIIYEEATYISDVEMQNSSVTKEKMIPSTEKKNNYSLKELKSSTKLNKRDKSNEKDKRKKEYKF